MKYIALFLIFLSLLYNRTYGAYIGPVILYRDYKEMLPSPLKSQERGILYGFRGGLSSNIAKFLYTDLSLELVQGQTNYLGTRQSLINYKISEMQGLTNNTLLNIEGTLGLPFKYRLFIISPFWGAGYHLWERELQEYLEKYKWPYIHFGVTLSFELFSLWKIGLEFKEMQTKFASVEIQEIYPWNLDLSLFNKLQYAIKLYNELHFKYISIILAVFYRHLEIGPSQNEKTSSFSSPLSVDKILGSEIILKYNF